MQQPASGQPAANASEATRLCDQLVSAVQRDVLLSAASWFTRNDPDAEQYYPNFKLREMAAGELELQPQPELAQSRQQLEALVADALAWRALQD